MVIPDGWMASPIGDAAGALTLESSPFPSAGGHSFCITRGTGPVVVQASCFVVIDVGLRALRRLGEHIGVHNDLGARVGRVGISFNGIGLKENQRHDSGPSGWQTRALFLSASCGCP